MSAFSLITVQFRKGWHLWNSAARDSASTFLSDWPELSASPMTSTWWPMGNMGKRLMVFGTGWWERWERLFAFFAYFKLAKLVVFPSAPLLIFLVLMSKCPGCTVSDISKKTSLAYVNTGIRWREDYRLKAKLLFPLVLVLMMIKH